MTRQCDGAMSVPCREAVAKEIGHLRIPSEFASQAQEIESRGGGSPGRAQGRGAVHASLVVDGRARGDLRVAIGPAFTEVPVTSMVR